MQRSKLIPLTLLVASVNLTTYAQDDTSATSAAVDTSTTEASTTNTNNANAKKQPGMSKKHPPLNNGCLIA